MANPLLARSNQQPVDPANVSLAASLQSLCNEAFRRHQAGQLAEAIRYYEVILSLKNDLPDIHNNLGHALIALGRHARAANAFQQAIHLKPHFPEALCNWGMALKELGHLDEAEAKFLRAIRVNPRFAGAYNNLGLLHKERGRLAQAAHAFQMAIDLEPKNFAFYDNLAAVRPFAASDHSLSVLKTAARDCATLSIADQTHLHFALAKAYDNLDQPDDSFRHLLNANRLKRQQIRYDEADTLGQMARLRELISRDFIESRQGCGEPSALPVFIVGMTRSGTTLIEQILASHPQIYGAGELSLLEQVASSMRSLLTGFPAIPEMILEMSPAHFRALGALYVHRLAQRAPQATRISDKMTANFFVVGLIHLALPNATIIHAVRDPSDTCVSCFSMHFTRGNEHTYDLAELGRYYRHYRELMAHWHDVLPPGRIVDVHYEELVADLEGVSRRIVARCGLDWDPRCLDFHHNERPIRTASAAQVRKPIYRNAIGRWRKHEALLAPLLNELAPLPSNQK